MVQKWKVLDSQWALNEKWYKVRRDTLEIKPDQVIDYYIGIFHDVVMTIAVTPDNNVLLVRQYKHGVGDVIIELPAGVIDEGEDPLDAAKRELREETGLIAVYSINLWRVERSINDPRSPEHLVIFYRVQARGDVINNDADENLAVQWKSIDEPIEIGFPVHKGIFNRIKDRPGDFFDYPFKM